MSAYKMFKTDSQREVEGITLDYGDFQIKIARAGGSNVEFARCLERITKPHQAAIKNGVLDPKVGETIMRQVYAESVILGWTGMKDESGKDLPFNLKNVLKVLEDLPVLFQDIQEQAGKFALFRKHLQEELTKNS